MYRPGPSSSTRSSGSRHNARAMGGHVPAAKSLQDHVSDGTFRSRRHRGLLAGPVVRWSHVGELQGHYAAVTSDAERRAIGITFERAVRELHENAESTEDDLVRALEEIFALPAVPVAIAERRTGNSAHFRANEGRRRGRLRRNAARNRCQTVGFGHDAPTRAPLACEPQPAELAPTEDAVARSVIDRGQRFRSESPAWRSSCQRRFPTS